jgi:hypothetical protein
MSQSFVLLTATTVQAQVPSSARFPERGQKGLAVHGQRMSGNGMVRPCSWPLSARRLAGGTKRKEHAMSGKHNSVIAAIGIDIGKNWIHVVGLDGRGAVALRQKWSRGQVEARPRQYACLPGMTSVRTIPCYCMASPIPHGSSYSAADFRLCWRARWWARSEPVGGLQSGHGMRPRASGYRSRSEVSRARPFWG